MKQVNSTSVNQTIPVLIDQSETNNPRKRIQYTDDVLTYTNSINYRERKVTNDLKTFIYNVHLTSDKVVAKVHDQTHGG